MYYYYYNKKIILKIKLIEKKNLIKEIKKIKEFNLHEFKELKEFREFFCGERKKFDFFLDLKFFSKNIQKVLFEITKIPYGKTLTYSDISKKTGFHPRFIGHVCKINPYPILIPCHRVISKNGDINFQWGKKFKTYLQKMEKKFL